MLVFDLGGGTFDVSLLDVGDGVVEVRASAGDGHLGGDDFDKRVVDWLADEFKRDQGIDLREDPQALQRLYEAAERAKVELSSTTQAQINLPFITADASGPKHLTTTLARSTFDQLTQDLIERCRGPIEQALSDAKLSAEDIDEIIFVGGSTRIPAVQELVRRMTGGKEPNMSVNPDEVVAIGAALQAGVLKGDVEDVLLLDVTPLSLGVETLGGAKTKVIERNTTIPATRTEVFSTAEDNQSAVDVVVLQGERELAAQALFDSEDNLVRLDMSEYQERHTVSRLMGAPPGYVGYEEGGQLTEQVRRKPYSVVLFDEIEKAHPDVFNTLLALLDDGRLTDAQGHTVDFRNTVVIMTSNIGSPHLLEGLTADGELRDDVRDRVMGELRGHFRPEFLNRVDDIVLFKPLTLEEIEQIVDLQVDDVRRRLADRRMTLQITEPARALIAGEGYDPVYGARPLRRFIQREVETRIGRALIGAQIHDGATITLDAVDGELTVEWANPEDGATPEPEAPRETVGVGG